MIKEKQKTQLWAMAIAFFASFGGAGCMVTALRLESIQMGWVAGACAASAVVFSLCFRRKLGWAPLCLLALLGGYLWQEGSLERSVEGLVYHISVLYDYGYGWGAVSWTNSNPAMAALTPALCAMGILVAAAMAWTVAGRHTAWLGAPVSCLPLATCLVLTDTVPRERYLYMLLAALVLVILTQSVRRADEKKGNTLTAMAAIPVAAALAVLMLLCPQQTYTGQQGAEQLEEWVMDLLGIEEEPGGNNSGSVGLSTADKVNLRSAGPKTYQSSKVMTVVDQRGGTVYLRACAYDTYNGISWERSESSWLMDRHFVPGEETWTVTVSTRKSHDVVYVPYVVLELLTSLDRGRVENTSEQTLFEFQCAAMPEFREEGSNLTTPDLGLSSGPDLGQTGYFPEHPITSINVMQQYLQLPEGTAGRARQWVEDALGPIPEITDRQAWWQYVQDVVELVRSSADYNLRTKRMPDGEMDFAMWFLEDSDTGYCVHFATAATVLLRSVGIPARYVTGYLTHTQADEPATVRMRDAHAWVEVYDAASGWLTLDPTPAGFGSPVRRPQETTEPEETTLPEETTQPSQQVTLPEETTGQTLPMPTVQQTLPEHTEPAGTVGNIGGADGPGTVQKDSGEGLLWLLPVVAAVSALIGQWQLRLWLRRKKQHTGTANEQALARWREVELHGKLRRSVPEELRELAQKAKFSQHMLTRQELRQFEVYLIRSRQELRGQSLWKRLYHTLILAIY